jgi:ketosteroid isomerase-like protein
MAMLDVTQAPDSPARRFVQVFKDGWKNASTYEAFVAHFLPWIHPDIRATLPMMPVAVGLDGFRDQFRRSFALFPDMRGTVKRATVEGDVAVIEVEMTATLGGKPFAWTATDRFTLAGDKVKERITSFNPVPLLFAILTRPSAWGVWWRSGVGPPPRRVRA